MELNDLMGVPTIIGAQVRIYSDFTKKWRTATLDVKIIANYFTEQSYLEEVPRDYRKIEIL